MKKRNKGCLTAIVIITVAAWITIRPSNPKIKKHLDSVDWLPSTASDISYWERKGFGWIKVYECTMAEGDFLLFAKQNGWTLEEREEESVHFRNLLGEPPLRKIPEIGIEMDFVPDALVFEDRQSNNGGITVVYDRELSRLFYSSSHR